MVALWIFWIALFLIAVQFWYPLFLFPLALLKRRTLRLTESAPAPEAPLVSVIITVHDRALPELPGKIRNILESDYPADKLELIVAYDGHCDTLEEVIRQAGAGDRIRYFQSEARVGKNRNLNRAVELSRGEILLFSDADSLYEPGAISILIRRLAPAEVGGACGLHRVIKECGMRNAECGMRDVKNIEAGAREGASGMMQALYWRYEQWLKRAEMKILGSVTSNYGTIFAMKRELFEPIPDGVTDDLFMTLSVTRRRRTFLFEPRARATIHPPAKSASGELTRRRRIVGCSLQSLWCSRAIFMPPDPYAICIFMHKVLRRLVPFLLMAALLASAALAMQSLVWQIVFWGQVLFYLVAGVALWGRISFKPVGIPAYIMAANIGTVLGIMDFLKGRRVATWE